MKEGNRVPRMQERKRLEWCREEGLKFAMGGRMPRAHPACVTALGNEGRQ